MTAMKTPQAMRNRSSVLNRCQLAMPSAAASNTPANSTNAIIELSDELISMSVRPRMKPTA